MTRHIASVQHKQNAEAVKTTHTLSFASCLSKDKVKPIYSNKLQNMLKLPGLPVCCFMRMYESNTIQ